MPVIEDKSNKIYKLNEDLSKFIFDDEDIKKELDFYLNSCGKNLDRETLSYFIYDKTIKNNKKIIDIYLEKNKNIGTEEKKALKELKNSVYSIFEVKKVLKDGFELYNLVNEKAYTVKSLIKMLSYRGIVQGNYFISRIIPYEKENYLLVLNSVLTRAEKQKANKIAVTMQVETPELLYKDNSKKLKEIEKSVKILQEKFIEFFGKDEIVTLNTNIEELLGAFNDFTEENIKISNPEKLAKLPEKYSYFKVQDSVDPFDFSGKKPSSGNYDVGIVFDPEQGILVLPFYGTFKQIFTAEDYTKIEGYKDCVTDYLKNPKIPPYVLKKVNEEQSEYFLKRISEIMSMSEPINIDELLHNYKEEFLNIKKFSSTTVLYVSEAFNNLMEDSIKSQQERNENTLKIGRNDPCYCGSGKKFKKCCMNQ